ncbi:MAG: hypothetical protein Q8K64_13265, partial [Sediminibacterium sp.]|nr:hypothetical protein [Sediminibacterium sp.]
MKKNVQFYNITRYLADALAIVLAYFISLLIHFGDIAGGFSIVFLSLSIAFWYVLSQVSKLYADRRSNKFSEEI